MQGVAEALGLDATLKRVAPAGVFRLASPWAPVAPKEKFGTPGSLFAPPWPDVAFATGRLTTPYIRALKRKAGLHTFTVVLQDPKTGPGTADLIWVPQHDRRRGPNVITTLTAPHSFSATRFADLRSHVPPEIAALPGPRFAVILGGKNGVYKFTDEDDQRAGWVSIHHPFDLELTQGKIYANEYMNLGLRIDRWRIPGAVLKAHLADAEAARLEQTGQERLSKTQRDDVRAIVVRKLREQFLPAMRVVDFTWNLNTGVVRFFSHSSTVHDTLTEVFETTFKGLTLVADGAYVRAENLKLASQALDEVAGLEPTPFHVGAMK